MKSNSCLYSAVKKVIEYQFGINGLRSDVFDRYNSGDGVPATISVSVINEALGRYGIEVDRVYGNFTDPHKFDRPDLIVRDVKFIPAPCIGYSHDHCEGTLPNERFSALWGITLKRV